MTPPPTPGTARGRRIQVRRSGIHGKGVFAVAPIAAGETIIEYTGKVISWKKAQKRHPHNPDEPNHTFFFHIDDKHVIDGNDGGSAAKWINHAAARTARPTRTRRRDASSSRRCATSSPARS
jgi:Proteins containing SET domain